MFDNRRIVLRITAIPLSPLGFIVDLDHIFSGGGDDAARVELQRCDGRVVAKGVVDISGAEIPDL
jgi:hypothetical protein